FGVISWRKEHEPAVIAQVAVGSPGRLPAARERNDLCRSSFPRHVASLNACAATRPRSVDDKEKTVVQRLNGLRFQLHPRLWWRGLNRFPTVSFVDRLQKMRNPPSATV